jgi:hypothetical protein
MVTYFKDIVAQVVGISWYSPNETSRIQITHSPKYQIIKKKKKWLHTCN